VTIKTTTTVAREEVNDRPGGGRRRVEGNTASRAAWYTPFWRSGSGNYSVLWQRAGSSWTSLSHTSTGDSIFRGSGQHFGMHWIL